MSYILEALRRAEAERARGAVPGLNTPAPEMADDESAAAPRPWLWLAAGVVAALAIVVGWRWSTTAGAPPAPMVASAPAAVTPPPIAEAPVARAPSAQPSAAQASAAQASAAQASAAQASAAQTSAAQTPAAQASAAQSRVAQAPTVQAPATTPPVASAAREPRTDAVTAAPSKRTAPAREAPVRKVPPAVAAASATPPPRTEPARHIYRQAELPDEIRRSLPRLSIGGSIYSESAASRMIIINGQVMHEGEKVGPDLELHQIRMKEAVLDFRGYRYEVPY